MEVDFHAFLTTVISTEINAKLRPLHPPPPKTKNQYPLKAAWASRVGLGNNDEKNIDCSCRESNRGHLSRSVTFNDLHISAYSSVEESNRGRF